MRYLDKRQDPIENTPPEEKEAYFQEIVNEFSLPWLIQKGPHPVQRLWQRKDWLATCELYTLGNAILKLKKRGIDWVKDKIRLIMGEDANNRVGAFNELIGSSYFVHDTVNIILAKRSQKAYDVTVEDEGGFQKKISLKKYGPSVHEGVFIRESQICEDLIKRTLIRSKTPPLQVCISLGKYFETEEEWTLLRKALNEILKGFRGINESYEIDSSAVIDLNPINDEEYFSNGRVASYKVIVTSPYHRNEKINLFAKLDQAFSKLARYAGGNLLSDIFVVYINLPITASAVSYSTWAEDYLKRPHAKRLSSIVIHQPFVLDDRVRRISGLSHFFSVKINSDFKALLGKKPHLILKIVIPVGVESKVPPHYDMVLNGDVQTIKGRYVFQRGHLFKKAKRDSLGDLIGTVSKQPPGVIEHLVIEPRDGKGFYVSGIFPNTNELLIL